MDTSLDKTDLDGSKSTATKPDGTVVSNAYDAGGYLSAVTATRGAESETVSYTYDRDDDGFITSAGRGAAAIYSWYGGFLKVFEDAPSGGYLWRDYDDDFRLAGIELYGADDTFLHGYGLEYDDDGALAGVSDRTYEDGEYGWPDLVETGRLVLTRDPATGFLTGAALGALADAWTYNGFGEVTGRVASASGTALYSAFCARDALGRVQTLSETVGGATVGKAFSYDLRGRLVSVTTDGVLTESYAYDANGNRTNSLVAADLRAAQYDAQDRLLTYGGIAFSYDANGSLTNRTADGQSTAYAYDLFGQLAAVSLPDGRTVSYDRDAFHRVTSKRMDGAITKGWIYKDALKPLAETDAIGGIVSWFVYGTSPISPDYMIRDGATYRFVRDVQGSVRLVVDADTGAIA
jgi:YD repeat-containing protein